MSVSYYASFYRKAEDTKIQKAMEALQALARAEVYEIPDQIRKTLGIPMSIMEPQEAIAQGEEALLKVGYASMEYIYASTPPGVDHVDENMEPTTANYPHAMRIDLDELPDEIRVILLTVS